MQITQTGIAVTVALVIVIGVFVFGFPLFQPSGLSKEAASASGADILGDTGTSMPSDSNSSLTIQDQTLGTGLAAAAGDELTVNYVGALSTGQVFDSTADKDPFVFQLGAGNVIAGWDRGLVGMKEGGKRILVIPPSLGYGANDYGPIPGNSTLIFQVELVKVTKGE